MLRSSAGGALLWGLFFLICWGLGYPTLNRYAPGVDTDAAEYYDLVVRPSSAFLGQGTITIRPRLLIPYLAKPVASAARGHIGTWDPVNFGLLVVNAALCATAASCLVALGTPSLGRQVAIIGALLYLSSFAIPNFLLAGLVDATVACGLLTVALAMARDRWWLLPWLAIAGTVGKETFAPLVITFAVAWWLGSRQRGSRDWCPWPGS